jgi:hypothetical protein
VKLRHYTKENADFVDTDIPYDFMLPEKHFVQEATREVGPHGYCSPRHHMHCVRWFLELNGIL